MVNILNVMPDMVKDKKTEALADHKKDLELEMKQLGLRSFCSADHQVSGHWLIPATN
jgi:hypothetical protein